MPGVSLRRRLQWQIFSIFFKTGSPQSRAHVESFASVSSRLDCIAPQRGRIFSFAHRENQAGQSGRRGSAGHVRGTDKMPAADRYPDRRDKRDRDGPRSLCFRQTMSNRLPAFLKEKVLSLPEYRQGAHKVRVTLKNGTKYSSVFIAWGDEIVKVGSSVNVPFNVDDIVEVENDL